MSKWISVEKEKPDYGVYVLCLNKNEIHDGAYYPAREDVFFAAWCAKNKIWSTDYWSEGFMNHSCSVTHWSYLPELP